MDAQDRQGNGDLKAFDPRAWKGFENFNEAQMILDHNRLLINEIKANHESRHPDGLTRNVTLIRELNNNLNKPPSSEWQGRILGTDLQLDDSNGHAASDPFVQFTASSKVLNAPSLGFGALTCFLPSTPAGPLAPPAVHRNPIRCDACGAFASLYSPVQPSTGEWRCLFCGRISYSGGELLIAAAVESASDAPSSSHDGETGTEGAEAEPPMSVSESGEEERRRAVQREQREAAVTAEVQGLFPELCCRVVDFVRPLGGAIVGGGSDSQHEQQLQEQQPQAEGSEGPPLVLLVDETMAAGSLGSVQEALAALLHRLPPSTRLALISFSSCISVFDLSSPPSLATAHVLPGSAPLSPSSQDALFASPASFFAPLHTALPACTAAIASLSPSGGAVGKMPPLVSAVPRALGVAVEAALLLLEGSLGSTGGAAQPKEGGLPSSAGHILLLTSGPSTIGPAACPLSGWRPFPDSFYDGAPPPFGAATAEGRAHLAQAQRWFRGLGREAREIGAVVDVLLLEQGKGEAEGEGGLFVTGGRVAGDWGAGVTAPGEEALGRGSKGMGGEGYRAAALRRSANQWGIDTAAASLRPLAEESGGALLLLPPASGADGAACLAANVARAAERLAGGGGLVELRTAVVRQGGTTAGRQLALGKVIGPARVLSAAEAGALREGRRGVPMRGGAFGDRVAAAYPQDSSQLLQLSCVAAGQGLALGFELQRDLREGQPGHAYFQFAFSFIDRNRTAILRVINLRLPVAPSLPAFLASIRPPAAAVFLAKRTLLTAATPAEAEEVRRSNWVGVRAKDMAARLGPGPRQGSALLQFPTQLPQLAEALYHLQRSTLLGNRCSEAQRITERHLFLSASLSVALPLLVPRLLMRRGGAQSFTDVPPADVAIGPDAVLVLDRGTTILLWLGPEVTSEGLLTECRQLAAHLGEGRFPVPWVATLQPSRRGSALFGLQLMPVSRDPVALQELLFPPLRELSPEQRAAAKALMGPLEGDSDTLGFRNELSFSDWMRSLKLDLPA